MTLGDMPSFPQQEMKTLWPQCDDGDLARLGAALKSKIWCRAKDHDWRGGECGLFEREFADFLGARHVMAVANGTVAIEIALAALAVCRGDEVLVQAGTFFGSVTPLLKAGAVPVFVEIDPTTYGLDLDNLEARITPKSKGVIAVHLSGLCPDMDRLVQICRQRGLWLIEDCAQAVGTAWRGRKLGTIGDLGTFSFQQDKPLTAGEGGAVVSNDDGLIGRAFAFHQGFGVNGCPNFAKHEISTNGRLSVLQGALLRRQLSRVPGQIAQRAHNADRLFATLAAGDPIEPVRALAGVSQWSIYSVPFHYRSERCGGMERDRFLAILKERGVPGFQGHLQPLYQRPLFVENPDLVFRNDGCPVTERISRDHYIAIMQPFFLGPVEWMDQFVALIRTIQNRASDLRDG